MNKLFTFIFWAFILTLLLVLWVKFPSPTVSPLSPQISISPIEPTVAPNSPPDPRISYLTAFFDRYHAPQPYYITDYLHASDEQNLDYRLLPAISVQESSAGRHACGNNYWGWGSCHGRTFASVVEGINFVSDQLANGHYYKGKTIEQKLHSYNPEPSYAPKIIRLMGELKKP